MPKTFDTQEEALELAFRMTDAQNTYAKPGAAGYLHAEYQVIAVEENDED